MSGPRKMVAIPESSATSLMNEAQSSGQPFRSSMDSDNALQGYDDDIPAPVEATLISKKKKLSPQEKLAHLIRILIPLAQIRAFNEQGHLLSPDGSYNSKTNIADLLENLLEDGKLLTGQDEFIQLLTKANVDPKLIRNEMVRRKMLEAQQVSSAAHDSETAQQDSPNHPSTPPRNPSPVEELASGSSFPVQRRRRKRAARIEDTPVSSQFNLNDQTEDFEDPPWIRR